MQHTLRLVSRCERLSCSRFEIDRVSASFVYLREATFCACSVSLALWLSRNNHINFVCTVSRKPQHDAGDPEGQAALAAMGSRRSLLHEASMRIEDIRNFLKCLYLFWPHPLSSNRKVVDRGIISMSLKVHLCSLLDVFSSFFSSLCPDAVDHCPWGLQAGYSWPQVC